MAPPTRPADPLKLRRCIREALDCASGIWRLEKEATGEAIPHTRRPAGSTTARRFWRRLGLIESSPNWPQRATVYISYGARAGKRIPGAAHWIFVMAPHSRA